MVFFHLSKNRYTSVQKIHTENTVFIQLQVNSGTLREQSSIRDTLLSDFFVVQEFYIPFEMCVYFDWSYTTQHKIQCDGEIYCQYTLFCIIISDFDYRQVGVNFFCTYSRLYKELATLTHPRHHIRNSWYKCMHKMFDVYVVFCGKNELFYFCLVKCIKKGLGF